MKQDAILRLAETIAVNANEYRDAQCRKYYAEKSTEHLGDYTKLERYKNRVRLIDVFLKPLEQFLSDCGVIHDDPEHLDQSRTHIE